MLTLFSLVAVSVIALVFVAVLYNQLVRDRYRVNSAWSDIDVQQAWSEKFVSVFAGLANNGATGYSPAWYCGNWDNSQLASTTDSLSSGLSTSISSASTPPGSSSGSGGGGFSGGGGGGGGTGGW